MREALLSKPAQMSGGPVLQATEDTAMTEEESQQLLALLAQILCGCLACAREVANRFMDRVGDPHQRQFASSVQPRKRDRVTAIGLHPIAWLLRNERGCDDRTIVPERLDLSVKPVSGGTCFVANVQLCVALGQLADHLLDGRRRTIDLAEIPNLATTATLRDRQRMLPLRRV